MVATFGLLPGFWLMRFLIGVGEAATYPCDNGVVAHCLPSQQRALAAGIIFAGIGAGSAFAPPFVALLMVHFGWRSAFYVCGGIGAVLALVFHLYVSGKKYRQRITAVIALPTPTSCQKTGQASTSTPWKQILRHPQVWLLTASDFLFGYIGYIYFYWFYLYLVEIRGFSLLRGSSLAALPFVAIAIFAPLGGWLSDRLIGRVGKIRARRRVAMSGLISGMPLIIAGATAHNGYIAVAFLSLAAGAIYFTLGCYWSTALELLPTHGATVSGVMNTGANLGGIVSPVLTPYMAARFGWVAALGLAAAFSLIAGVLWQFIGPLEDSG